MEILEAYDLTGSFRVAAKLAGRGVATRLMEAVEQWGRDHGAVLASLDTWAHSTQSVPFYEQRMGYQRASIIFEKRLDSSS